MSQALRPVQIFPVTVVCIWADVVFNGNQKRASTEALFLFELVAFDLSIQMKEKAD
jgi:hypothetical protein